MLLIKILSVIYVAVTDKHKYKKKRDLISSPFIVVSIKNICIDVIIVTYWL